jgi:hypothetical protein
LALKLGLFQNSNSENKIVFSKQKPEPTQENSVTESKKLSIGFKSNENEEIDED